MKTGYHPNWSYPAPTENRKTVNLMSLGIAVKDLLSESLSTRAFFNKDSEIGDTVSGTILDAEVRQSRDFDDNKLEFWNDGSPVLQLVVNIQTDLNDPEGEDGDDDGVRSIYVKWWGASRKALLRAIKDAGADDLETGATFTASYVGDGEQPDKKKSKPKLYAYGYKPAGVIAQATARGK